jgi:hypothetical protein
MIGVFTACYKGMNHKDFNGLGFFADEGKPMIHFAFSAEKISSGLKRLSEWSQKTHFGQD